MSLVILNLDHKNDEIDTVLHKYGLTEYADKLRIPSINKLYKRIIDTHSLVDHGVSYVSLSETGLQKGWPADLRKQGILSFLRADSHHIAAGMPVKIDIDSKIKAAKEHMMVGIKIRAYIENVDSIEMIVNILLNYAHKIQRAKLLPIVEIVVRKEWEDKADREKQLFDVLFKKWHHLYYNNILIVSPPETPGTFDDMNRFEVIKGVGGSDYGLTSGDYLAKMENNNLFYSVSETVFEGLKIHLDDKTFKSIFESNLKKLGE